MRRWAKKATSAKISNTIASVPARPKSAWAPTTAKKISVDSTPIEPPSRIGLPKSARLSMKTTSQALANPGSISGNVMLAKVRAGLARSVCEASSMVGEMPWTTPIRTRNAVGVNENTCASQTPLKP